MNIASTEICKQYRDDGGSSSSQLTDFDNELPLIPGLPDHIAHRCLTPINPLLLYSVCHSWRRLVYSPDFPPFFSLYTLLYPTSPPYSSSSALKFASFDPISSTWNSLPNPPSNTPLRFLYRHPSFISRILPIQSLTLSGKLLLIAGTTHDFLPALDRPLGFDPSTKKWFFGPPLPCPRRWCITGSADGVAYVISGVGSGYRGDVARSVEKWDMKKKESEWKWEKMAALKDGRFSREGVEAIGFRGKLCMVNVKGNAIKEGALYNILTNEWEEMPKGMLEGWNGPAAVDETEGVIYVVDEANGILSRYNPDNDQWEEVIRSPEYLKGAEHMVVGGGRVCAVAGGRTAGDARRVVIVDVVNDPHRTWIVNPPPEMELVAVHIMTRIIFSAD